MCFKTFLNHPINQKTSRKKKPKAITVLKKEGGGPARYDHDHRFNGFFFDPFPYNWPQLADNKHTNIVTHRLNWP